MTERTRLVTLSLTALFLALIAVTATLVTIDWVPLRDLDRGIGRPAEQWARDEPAVVTVGRIVEAAFGTLAMTLLTVVLSVALFLRRHRRAAYFTVAVMAIAAASTTALKEVIGRERPVWQNPVQLLENQAFPSGHASSATAFAGVAVVIVAMLVRRAAVRRILYATCAGLVVLVCADRVLLGRHYASDVVGGVFLGVLVVLLVATVYSPFPRGQAAAALPLVDTVPGTRDLAVVLNPIKVKDVGQFRATVEAMAAEAGWSVPTWQHTTIADPGAAMAERAAVSGADLVLVCGGDGTVREVCAELAGTGIPIGIVPAGTGNLLARNLDIPLYLRSAIDVALNGQDRAIDLVKVSGDGLGDTHFMVMAGMGFDAAIMEGVNEDFKAKVGWIAYVLSAVKSLMFPAIRVEVSVDDEPFTKHRARTVMVGNVGYLQAGMPLLPDAAIDDGRLDVVLLHPRRFLSWIPLVVRVLTKQLRTDETLDRMTGAKVVIRASTEAPRQLDGDSIGPGKELRMECIHGRLLVRVPR